MGLITVARMGIAENLVRLRTAANLSQTALAKKAKVSQQLISQLERGENTTTKNLPAIAGALGVPVSSIDPSYHTPAVQARMVRVEGFVQAGEWEETWTWPEDDQYEVPVPMDPELIGYRLHAAETRGPSMNRRYPEKTVVIFTDAIETGEDVVPGYRYVIERERADGLKEATVKLLWTDESGRFWLLPESNDPRFQEPIAIDANEDDTIRVIGRVRYAVSRE
jgi:transcriptional regulator with XRE-family HTH domain